MTSYTNTVLITLALIVVITSIVYLVRQKVIIRLNRSYKVWLCSRCMMQRCGFTGHVIGLGSRFKYKSGRCDVCGKQDNQLERADRNPSAGDGPRLLSDRLSPAWTIQNTDKRDLL